MKVVEQFHAKVTDEPSLWAFLRGRGVEGTDTLIVATPEGEILATVDHPHPRSASIVVLR